MVTKAMSFRCVLALVAFCTFAATDSHADLANPSFEEPRFSPGTESFDFAVDTDVPGWRTTAPDHQIEFWSDGFGDFSSFAGDQHVELNAFFVSTLYQDTTAIPMGARVGFTFAHRGRSGLDTMRLTITDSGSGGIFGDGNDVVLFTKEYSTDETAWHQYTSVGEAPMIAGGNPIRFAYASVSAAGGDPTVGNFIDDAHFGADVAVSEPRCGDGIVQAELGEECDDDHGNLNSCDGCNAFCKLEQCGSPLKELFVLGSNNIVRFDASTQALVGQFVAPGTAGMLDPVGLTVGPDGDLYVLQHHGGQIMRYNGCTGGFRGLFIDPTGCGNISTDSHPHDLAFGPDGNLYVLSLYPESVVRFDGRTGACMGTFGMTAGNIGGNPETFAFGPGGDLYVAGYSSGWVYRFDSTGAPNGSSGAMFASVPYSAALAFDATGNVYIGTNPGADGEIYRYDTSGIGGLFVDTAHSGGLQRATGMAFGPAHELYVTDSDGANGVLRYSVPIGSTTGTFLGAFAPAGTGGLNSPSALAFSCDCHCPAPMKPDLSVESVDAQQMTTDCKTRVVTGHVDVIISNNGPVSTGGSFTVVVFEDAPPYGTFGSTDTVLGSATRGPLGKEAGDLMSITVSGTLAFSGDMIWAKVDADPGDPNNQNGVIDESNENNNLNHTRCEFHPTPGPFTLVPEWQWTRPTNPSDPSPQHVQVMMTPIVAPLTSNDVPNIVFSAFAGSAYMQDGVVRAIRGDNGADVFVTSLAADRDVVPAGAIAVGDIDPWVNNGAGDGPEIIASEDNSEGGAANFYGLGGFVSRLIIFDHAGNFKLKSPCLPEYPRWGGPAIADLNKDGIPEIVVGHTVLSWNAAKTELNLFSGAAGFGDNGVGPLSTVADIDNDGWPDIVAGFTVYNVQLAVPNTPSPITGLSVKWNARSGDGFPAVGNFDTDPQAEVVVVSNGRLYLIDDDGALLWNVPIPAGSCGTVGGVGPPTVGDLAATPGPEIGVAGACLYVVFDSNGNVVWSSPTQDGSSNRTGSSVFDFEGDGKAEVVYKDERALRVYRGETGSVAASFNTTSGTTYENPVIADVDDDGRAEIVVCANDYGSQSGNPGAAHGIQVFRDANNAWVNTRKIWNQHTYHITNVNDDATIPVNEAQNASNWNVTGLNNFRAQKAPGSEIFAVPNLTASYIRTTAVTEPCGLRITARVGNGGGSVARAPVHVTFRVNGIPTVSALTTQDLEPGEWEDVTVTVPVPATDTVTICVTADDAGFPGSGSLAECNEDDNTCCITVQNPCLCGRIKIDNILCNDAGYYLLTFFVTNLTSSPVTEVRFPAATPSVVSITIPAKATRLVKVKLYGLSPNTTYTFPVDLLVGGTSVCSLLFQVDVPDCRCLQIPYKKADCTAIGPNAPSQLYFRVTRLENSGIPAASLLLTQDGNHYSELLRRRAASHGAQVQLPGLPGSQRGVARNDRERPHPLDWNDLRNARFDPYRDLLQDRTGSGRRLWHSLDQGPDDLRPKPRRHDQLLLGGRARSDWL